MNLDQTHLDITKERFLELMAQNPLGDPKAMVELALSEACDFTRIYKNYAGADDSSFDSEPPKKLKGCKKCYGSGGKANAPCAVCHGTGKVAE